MQVAVELTAVVLRTTEGAQLIVLKEADGDRSFPIVIGMNEALAIQQHVHGLHPPRPMTHDLLRGVIDACGATLQKVVITTLSKGTFFAELHLQLSDGNTVQVDARPSDSIALAVRLEAPLFVDEEVITDALS